MVIELEISLVNYRYLYFNCRYLQFNWTYFTYMQQNYKQLQLNIDVCNKIQISVIQMSSVKCRYLPFMQISANVDLMLKRLSIDIIVPKRALAVRAVPGTRVARACWYSSSKKLELYFWARVLNNFLQTPKSDKNRQTFVSQVWDKFSLAWDDVNQFRNCPSHTVEYPGTLILSTAWRSRALTGS